MWILLIGAIFLSIRWTNTHKRNTLLILSSSQINASKWKQFVYKDSLRWRSSIEACIDFITSKFNIKSRTVPYLRFSLRSSFFSLFVQQKETLYVDVQRAKKIVFFHVFIPEIYCVRIWENSADSRTHIHRSIKAEEWLVQLCAVLCVLNRFTFIFTFGNRLEPIARVCATYFTFCGDQTLAHAHSHTDMLVYTLREKIKTFTFPK